MVYDLSVPEICLDEFATRGWNATQILSILLHKTKRWKISDPLFLMGTSPLLDGMQIVERADSNWMRGEDDYSAPFCVWDHVQNENLLFG